MTDKNLYLFEKLKEKFPNAFCELHFSSPFELLVAVALSAQSTDKRVNLVTDKMFKKWNKPQHFAELSLQELEDEIKSIGLYKNKAKNLILASKQIIEKFGGQVPNKQEELVSLAGVGVKTANVIRAVAFGDDAIAVDTHVFRVSNRLGIAKSKNANECEKILQKNFDKTIWSQLHYLLVLFGRYHCTAKKPKCDACQFACFCDYYKNQSKN